ncbi:sterol desaturase family protein [Algoriphagus boritolerans]|uniref:Fatty acid hydroxylase superfamily protein n=1 Tax=Algoriphagus boritolerans DSM 17298 = JCM 18970 TaxID=1120964 RepID=A0A1H5TJV2_9BACT|nr:sterol desaturase family protein [Algoriphagus boritolerans]SEF63043.1 Fatty acid hydroxylase superfamily protein [Algoriphagus boritolerans DSM 17298 = JCM 18970]
MKSTEKKYSPSLLFSFLKTGLILTGVFALAILFRGTPGYFIFLFIGGWISWTFVEYAVHRFILHELIVPGKKESLFHHQEHHINPQDIKVGFLHRIITLVLAIGIFWLALKLNNTFTIFAGFFTGFLFYSFLHYLLHQPYCKFILPKIQRAHIHHHTRYPNKGFSFSTILWDWLFDTLPPKHAEITEKMKENYFNSFKTQVQKNVKLKSNL